MELAGNYLMDTYGFMDIALVEGKGCYLYDTDGKEYLDFTSGIGVSSIGYNDGVLTAALKEQVEKLLHTSNIFLNPVMIETAEKLVKLSGMSKVFFSNSGAESNEGAIKLARKYSYDKYGAGRNKILTLNKSFHGRTLTALKATGQEKFHKFFFPFPEGFDYVKPNNIDDFKEKLHSSVCAVMLESIQGEGGVNPLSQEFVNGVVELCEEKDILIIFDEVQTGIGRTGKLFGYEHFGVKPNIVTVAKGLGAGLPMGGILCDEKLSKVFNKGDHGSTFGGNPLSLTAAKVVLDRVSKKEFLDEIQEKEQLIFNMFKEFNSPSIKEVRGKGLMIGVELNIDVKKVQKKAADMGLLVLTAGENTLRFLPPLVISKDEIIKGIEIIKKAISGCEG